MNEVRVLVQGTTRDLAAFSAYMKREAALIEENEPGTLRMEIFGDESTGAVVVHEVYLDADAFMKHTESLMEGPRMQEFLQLFEPRRFTFLTPIDDDRVRGIAEQLNAVQASEIAGFSRSVDG